MLCLITKNKIGNRPNRQEPRAIKRRRKPFPLLRINRVFAQMKLEKQRNRMRLKNAA